MSRSDTLLPFLLISFVCLTTGFNEIHLAGFELDSDLQQRIWRGKDAQAGQFAHQALLVMQNVESAATSACGGSLVHPSFVLTAAHCCLGVNYTVVLLGLVRITDFNQSFVQKFIVPSSNIIPHENYDSKTIANDICLLKLPTPATITSNVSAIALPTKANSQPSQYDWKMATISGWGQTFSLEGLHSRLKWSNVKLDSHFLCQLNYFMVNTVSNSQLCTGKIPWTGPCQGDSGGPLTVLDSSNKSVEIGIVSWGVGLCSSFNPVVYTYVPYFLDWIQNHIN